jgi:response regulator RpfG family c-di-GMP phosphodiesterase
MPAENAATALNPIAPLTVLLLDDDPQTLACVDSLCKRNGHRLYRAESLANASEMLDRHKIDLLISDLAIGGQSTAPLLKTLTQKHPQLLSLVATSFQDNQALLTLMNEAKIFRYLPKPMRPGLLDQNVKAAARQVLIWRTGTTA